MKLIINLNRISIKALILFISARAKILLGIINSVVLFSLLLACSSNDQNKQADAKKEQLIIFHAGSLTVPFKEVATAFNKEYPNVEILMEADGSRKCARKITDLQKECDIMASADYTVIDELLIPDYADWNIKFVSNEMSIVYHEASRYANEITKDNWPEILLKKDVAFGRSDPNSDPCGYRAVLTCKLAEDYYNITGLSESILSKDENYIRPKETDLLGLLESNAIDYIFLYRSVAKQHNLKYLILPDSINLKNTDLTEYYNSASVEISGRKPGEIITKKGEPMIYGVTILKNAQNKSAATNFVKFLLEKEKGLAILKENGQSDVVPSHTESYQNISTELLKYTKTSLLE